MAYQSRKKQKQKNFKVRFWVWSGVMLLVSIFAGMYYFSRYEPWMYETVSFEGNERVNVDEIEEIIFQELETPWYNLIASNNKWFFPKERIRNRILELKPLLKEVSFELWSNQQVLVRLEERGPEYIVCSEGKDLTFLTLEDKIEHCAFVDYNGLAFESFTPNIQHEALFIKQTQKIGQLPNQLFLGEEQDYFRELRDLLKEFDILYIHYTPGESTDVYLDDDFYIKFVELASPQEQFTLIENALKEPLSKDIIDKYTYFDVRFPGKLFTQEKESQTVEARDNGEEIEEGGVTQAQEATE